MHSLNLVVIAGNATRDPEVRYTAQGTPVAEFGLAINRRWKERRTDEWREETTFVEIRVMGQQADFAKARIRKGTPVHVEGRLQLDQWLERDSGAKRERLRVLGQQLTVLSQPFKDRQMKDQQPRTPKLPSETQPELALAAAF
jgi:single-strand DNA-binding protein